MNPTWQSVLRTLIIAGCFVAVCAIISSCYKEQIRIDATRSNR